MPRKPRPIEDRFWEKVDKTTSPNGCWLWTAAVSSAGYGQINQGGQHGTHIAAHKLSWQLANGPRPEHLCICHRCDNPRCVNPEHLFLGTQKDNIQDALKKGRKPFGEKHPLARWSEGDIRAMFAMRARGATQTEIADHFGTKQPAIQSILSRKAWSHVEIRSGEP